MSQPSYEVRRVRGADLVVCTIDGVEGTARVFSRGLEEAKQRAEEQARRLLAERNAPR